MRFVIIFSLFVLSFNTRATTSTTPYTPIVFVHGMLASSDTWVNPYVNFRNAGYSENDLYFLDWNTMSMNSPMTVQQLDSLVNHIIESTGKKKVNLVGHSAGGGICSSYLSDKKRAKKIDKYVHLASMPIENTPAVATLNLYSPDDKITGGKDYSGVTNKAISGLDHYEIATSKQSFEAMFQFFNPGGKLELTVPESASQYTISGRVCTLGDNSPEKNAQVEIYSFNKRSGARESQTPIHVLTTDENGYFPAILLNADTYYEFMVTSLDKSKRKVHYYREPFSNNNPLVYLRTMPSSGFAGFLLKSLPQNEDEACLAIFSSNKAILFGRDNLSVQGLDLARKDITPDSKTAIALFIFDEGSDKESSGMGVQTFKSFPFMNGVDYFLSVEENPIELNFNGRRMNVAPVKSSDGIMVVVFD